MIRVSEKRRTKSLFRILYYS